MRSDLITMSDKVTSSAKESDGFKKYSCGSCAYVFDEKQGFKKRIPPGTRFESLPTFMCPVCGAAKNQFKEVKDN